jgi:hypothetical protein
MPRPITYNDISIMQQYYNADQHPMVYQYYYSVTGTEMALVQSQISDPNTYLGQVAMGANESAQFLDNFGMQSYPSYGLHSFSREIAGHFIDQVKSDVDTGGTGILSNDEMLRNAQEVWDQYGIGNLFPGGILEGNLNSGLVNGIFGLSAAFFPINGPFATAIDPAYFFGGALDFSRGGNPFSGLMPSGWDSLPLFTPSNVDTGSLMPDIPSLDLPQGGGWFGADFWGD